MKTNNYFCLTGTLINKTKPEYLEDGNYTYIIIIQQFINDKPNNFMEEQRNIPVRLIGEIAEKNEQFLLPYTSICLEGNIQPIYEDAQKQTSGNERMLEPAPGTYYEGIIYKFDRLNLKVTAIKIGGVAN
ncbi:MAG: hypothetical protein WC947_01310 [Elusimicrobiota bacterium]